MQPKGKTPPIMMPGIGCVYTDWSGIWRGIWLVRTGCSNAWWKKWKKQNTFQFEYRIKLITRCWLTRFLNPKYAPTNVSGTETPNHRANSATNVLNGTAPELPSCHNTRFITKNSPKTILVVEKKRIKFCCCWYFVNIYPGQSIDVSITLHFHLIPPKLL